MNTSIWTHTSSAHLSSVLNVVHVTYIVFPFLCLNHLYVSFDAKSSCYIVENSPLVQYERSKVHNRQSEYSGLRVKEELLRL